MGSAPKTPFKADYARRAARRSFGSGDFEPEKFKDRYENAVVE
jgi:hypothetical protein